MKTALITGIFCALFLSCKKDHTCECITETGKLDSTHQIKATKKEAEKKCTPYNYGYSGNWEGVCELK